MIVRIWHGGTTPEDAEEYERLVVEENYGTIADGPATATVGSRSFAANGTTAP